MLDKHYSERYDQREPLRKEKKYIYIFRFELECEQKRAFISFYGYKGKDIKVGRSCGTRSTYAPLLTGSKCKPCDNGKILFTQPVSFVCSRIRNTIGVKEKLKQRAFASR
ncbi:uncharacterized protein LOC143422665 [Xylocopa sonorina]|uniref:uncharacterized protein LOC143422665 n=1 Tax=Xylocopa sonorina TaxID=1818115 RepID=UPI00403B2526